MGGVVKKITIPPFPYDISKIQIACGVVGKPSVCETFHNVLDKKIPVYLMTIHQVYGELWRV
jgi:hypothetical protein